MPETFEFSSDIARIDRPRVHAWLSGYAYWARGRSREVQEAAIDGSRNYGIYRRSTAEQVAYARVVTDGVTFAWLCDVYVDKSARGLGIGTGLVEYVCEDLENMNLTRVLLCTVDAHWLYRKFGFEPIIAPELWMIKDSGLSHA